MSHVMPTFNADILRSTLTAEEFNLFSAILSTQGKNKGCLRAAKPKITDLASAKAAYLWRMVAFQCSPVGAHQCIPVCADMDLSNELIDPTCPTYGKNGSHADFSEYVKALEPIRQARKAIIADLDKLADKITDTLPPRSLHGVLRWGRVLGMI